VASRVCYRCFTRLTRLGLSTDEITVAPELPAEPASTDHCAVSGCHCVPTVRHAVLCEPHARKFRARRPRKSMEQFLSDPRVRPFPPLARCQVAACIRVADSACGYCNTHYQRRLGAQRNSPGLDHRWWRVRESGVAEPGRVNLRALPALVIVEVLFGIQQRVRGGAKVTDGELRVLCDALRRQQITSIEADEVELTGNKPLRSLLGAVACHVRRALADPGSEQAKDVWDLAIFGHRGTLSFVGIAQPWLAQAAKRWAAERLPPATVAVGSPGSEARSTGWGCYRSTWVPGQIADSCRRYWAAATSRASCTGWPTWNQPARSAVTAATASAATCGRSWPGSAPWA